MTEVDLVFSSSLADDSRYTYYHIGDHYYDAVRLSWSGIFMLDSGFLTHHIQIDTSLLTADPIFITTIHDGWILLTVDDHTVKILNWSSPETLSLPILSMKTLSTPDLSNYQSGENRLSRKILPNSSELVNSGFIDASTGHSLNQISGFTIRLPSEIKISPAQNIIADSYETLLQHLYNFPESRSPMTFTSLDQITRMLSNNEISKYEINPILQPFGGKNIVITYFDKSDNSYFVKIKSS